MPRRFRPVRVTDVKLPSVRSVRSLSRKPAADAAPLKPEPAPGEVIDPAELRELRAQRDRLREKFTIMQNDLGGAFYEMAIRDHVRLDVLTRKAAELQKVDAELTVFERVVALQGSDAAGFCASCGAGYQHGQQFCSQCGHGVGTGAST